MMELSWGMTAILVEKYFYTTFFLRVKRKMKMFWPIVDTSAPPVEGPSVGGGPSLVYPSTFNSTSITVSAPRVLRGGAKFAYLNYSGHRLLMQTTVAMASPFGLRTFQNEYSVDVSFRGQENRPELQEFKRVLEQLDELMINEGVKNSQAWFSADLSKEVIQGFYTPSLSYSKDKEGRPLAYPPSLSRSEAVSGTPTSAISRAIRSRTLPSRISSSRERRSRLSWSAVVSGLLVPSLD